jgi:hypothetical protein
MDMLSYGLGVDSTAALVHGLEDGLDGFDPANLVVVTAMTGDEYTLSGELVAEFVLPILRRHKVRYVQIARGGQAAAHGYHLLSDSTATTEMVMAGDWALADEMFTNGTVPQVSTTRRTCSERAKGDPLDWWSADEFGDRPYRHAVGFSFDRKEQARAARDVTHDRGGLRLPWYPLIRWQWPRARCQSFLLERFGVLWPRSCCGYCPFQANTAGLVEMVARWRGDPARARQALYMELMSMAFNPRGVLFGSRSARQVARSHGLGDLVDDVDAQAAASRWAIYDVRRAYPARRLNPKGPSTAGNWDRTRKAQARRSVRTLMTGPAAHMRAVLAAGGDVEECDGGVLRAWTLRASAPWPSREAFVIAAPIGVVDKTGDGFDAVWADAQKGV